MADDDVPARASQAVDANPYETTSAQDYQVSTPRKLLAVGMGLLVFASGTLTLFCCAFGLLVAVAGNFDSAPVSLNGVMDPAQQGLAGILITVGVLVCAAVLGCYTTIRTLKSSHLTAECDERRRVLAQQVSELRQLARQEKASRSAD